MSDANTTSQPILRYQRDRTLDQVPGFGTGLQVNLGPDRHAYVALSPCEMTVYFDNPEHALHYDLEGRLLKTAEPNTSLRRGLSHKFLATRKRASDEGGGIERKVIVGAEVDAVVANARAQVTEVLTHIYRGATDIEFGKPSVHQAVEQLTPVLEKAEHFGVEAAFAHVHRFNEIYGRVAILPPDQYNALVLQATEGCAYGSCLYCELYRGLFHQRKTTAEFRDHVREAIAFHGEGLRARRSIFLGEANALALPQETLLEFFDVLNENFVFPPADQETVPARWWLGSKTQFDGVSSFLDLFTGRQHTTEDFKALRERGLRRVYIGLESGSEALLEWLCKPSTPERVRSCVHALKQAGIHVGIIVLLGAGGLAFDMVHRKKTAELINELGLGAGDYIYFSPLVIYRNSRYEEQTRALNMERLTAQQLDEQEQAIRAGLRFDEQRGRPYLARYEVETFVY